MSHGKEIQNAYKGEGRILNFKGMCEFYQRCIRIKGPNTSEFHIHHSATLLDKAAYKE